MYKMRSFYDSHLHFIGIGMNQLEYINLSDCRSFNDVENVLSEHTDREFIIARGWHQENFVEKEFFTKQLLNEVSNKVPIICIRACGHVLICNDKMMEIAGIDSSTPQVEGGTFDLHTGEFTENALDLINVHKPMPTKDRIKEYMKAANQTLLSHGVTACGSDDFSTLSVGYELIIEAYKEAYNEGLIDVRILQQVNIPDFDELQEFIQKGYHNMTFDKFKMGPLKLLADGSLGGKTAYMRESYSDDPGNVGVSTFTQDELDDLVYLADSNGMDVAIHAIGDRCIDMVLDAISKSRVKTKNQGRHSIIHAQLANLKQIARMKEMEIGAQTQPIFLNSDIPIIESRLGNRSKETYLFNTMYKLGIKTTISTDCPVEPINPFHNLYCAITRKSIKHDDLPPHIIEEGFAIDDSIKCYTETPYYFSYEEKKEYNDYIVTNKKVNIDNLLDIQVQEVYVDGEQVFSRSS